MISIIKSRKRAHYVMQTMEKVVPAVSSVPSASSNRRAADAKICTPFTYKNLHKTFLSDGSFSKHLLTIYSLAIGLNAKTIVDIGIGMSTRALLTAAETTGGTVHSCDFDVARYGWLAEENWRWPSNWRLQLKDSRTFAAEMPDGVDFVCHDGAHDYEVVKQDITALLPKMKRFGLITVHDTQHKKHGSSMQRALREVQERHPVTSVTLPFNCGLTILRVEESWQDEVDITGRMKGPNRTVTQPFSLMRR